MKYLANEINEAIRDLNESITFLGLAADSASLNEVEGELVEALYIIKRQLETHRGRLSQLLKQLEQSDEQQD